MTTAYSETHCPTLKTHIGELLVFVFLQHFLEFFDQFGRDEIRVPAAAATERARGTLETRLFHRAFRSLHRAVQELLELDAQGATPFPRLVFKPPRDVAQIVPVVGTPTSDVLASHARAERDRPEEVVVPVFRLAAVLAHVTSRRPRGFTSTSGADDAICPATSATARCYRVKIFLKDYHIIHGTFIF